LQVRNAGTLGIDRLCACKDCAYKCCTRVAELGGLRERPEHPRTPRHAIQHRWRPL